MFHLIGIDDVEMCALAQFIKHLGYKVDGSSDRNIKEITSLLKEQGINIKPYSKNNISDEVFIIVSDNITENVELECAKELNLKVYTCSQMKKRFTSMFETIAIAGCVGKDITTLMTTYVLSYITGCNYMLNDGRGYAEKDNKYLCIEALEDKKKFLNINPYYTILTNIEFNYPDYYQNIDEVLHAYSEFINKTEKMVIANGDDRYTRLLDAHVPIFYYGLKDDNDIVAREIEATESGTSFEVYVEGNFYGKFELPIYGKASLLNTLAVIGMCHYERIECREVAKALKEFYANNKVYNEKYLKDLVLVNSEFNHPLEIKNIIKWYREKYPENKIKVIFNLEELFQNEVFNQRLTEYINLADMAYISGTESLDNSLLSDINNKELLLSNSIKDITKEKDLTLIFLSNKQPNVIQLEIEKDIENKHKALK